MRPFIYRSALRHGIVGSVSNDREGVRVRAGGRPDSLEAFLLELEREHPPQAVVEEIGVEETEPFHDRVFRIDESRHEGSRPVLVSPDLATCPDCLRELFDPSDRRFLYPFINCTNCGPRITIISDTPYDRPLTSMARFVMCPDCEREYRDPGDRRFHAQPNACPACGPRLWLADRQGRVMEGDPVAQAATLLRRGHIVAVKGLGGFQLACDATSDAAVKALRERKRRYGKPLAVMVRDLEQASEMCRLDPEEAGLLASPRAPIVLLRERKGSPLSSYVAGGLAHQGVFLPYTPLHHLLLRETDLPLVMTSGNLSEEPIVTDNDEAVSRLGGIADYFLLHDRDILVRYDDSVTRFFMGGDYPVRRARGYAPYPVRLARPAAVEVLAVGGELKNTFCLLRGEHAFVGQHVGDMGSLEALMHFEAALETMTRLFRLRPCLVAHDLHPDYVTTRWAVDHPLPRVAVQHHHAHVVSCMAENGLSGEVIGVAWDGTGYGEDGTSWGGEFLVCDEKGYRRAAHLFPLPMPGGDACTADLARMAAGALSRLFPGEEARGIHTDLFGSESLAEALFRQLDSGFNTPLTTGAGRLFDAASAILGLRREVQYEGQAACELEAAAEGEGVVTGWELLRQEDPWVVDTRPLLQRLVAGRMAGEPLSELAADFHATLADIIVRTCLEISRETGLKRVALSGGVFQNLRLAAGVVRGLDGRGLQVFLHRKVPCNDGGLSLGQAVIAAERYGDDSVAGKRAAARVGRVGREALP